MQHYLWRAVDQTGAVIDILVQPKRDHFAAIRFFHKLLRTTGCQPRVIITDKLRSYGAAKKIILPRVAHRQSRYLNNRAENSHQPTRQRERRMKRFKSPEHAQRFLERHDILAAHFRPQATSPLLRTTKRDGRIDWKHDTRSSPPDNWIPIAFRVSVIAPSTPFIVIRSLPHRNVNLVYRCQAETRSVVFVKRPISNKQAPDCNLIDLNCSSY